MVRSSLPSVVALGSPGPQVSRDGVASRKYLGYVSPGDTYDVQFYFRFSVRDAVAKFALEPAKSGEGLVNVRCCYNNKYWSRPDPNESTIIAEVSEAVEDKSSYKCTLFKPNLVEYEGKPAVQFVHVQTGGYLVLHGADVPEERHLMVGESECEKPLTTILVDYESLVFLPKRVMFRGNNQKFLQPATDDYTLQFSGVDPTSESILQEVFTTSDGQIQIKNTELGKYWRRSTSTRTNSSNSNWVKSNVDKVNGDDPSTLFEVVKMGGGVGRIALRNAGNNLFCKRLTMGEKEECLNASGLSSRFQAVELQVGEAVVSRVVKDVEYRLDAGRVYGVESVIFSEGYATNEGDTEAQIQSQFEGVFSNSMRWDHNYGVSDGVETKFVTGIPFINAEGKIEVLTVAVFEYNWGETKEENYTVSTSSTVTVPPNSKIRIVNQATKGTCEVPFSYTQVDQLSDGGQVSISLDDGVFTGEYYYDVRQVFSDPEPIS